MTVSHAASRRIMRETVLRCAPMAMRTPISRARWLAAVVLALSVSASAASLLPARRAASVNPIDALRAE